MKIYMIYVRDENFYQLLPEKLCRLLPDDSRARVMAFPPLGIQTLAPVVRQHGHAVRMFDTCHPQMHLEHIVQAAKKELPEVIALSVLSTTTYPAAKSMARMLKIAAPSIKIIMGGVFASMNSVNVLKDCPYLDCVGVGEGEELLPDYLDNLDKPGEVAGLVWRNGEGIIQNDRRPQIDDLNQFPYPDRISLPIDYIESLPLDVPAVLSLDKFCTMQTSRGCPYNCIYCDIPVLSNRKWRYRSPEHVLGEMQELNDMGYRSVYFTDDHFLLKPKRIEKICKKIIEKKFDFRWGCEGRVDSAAIENLSMMKEAHCNYLFFGVEAGTQKVLDRLNKKQSLEQIEYAVNEAKRQRIERVHGSFIIGSPSETEEDIKESFRFAARLKIDTFNFNRLCAYRGTPLWKEYVELGIIDDNIDWHKWFKCSDIDPDVLPGEALNRLRMKGYALLFAKRVFFRPIKTYKLLRAFSRSMGFLNILKLLLSSFRKRTMSHNADLPHRTIDLRGIGSKRGVYISSR
ncbi:B12-binding domain-containing radical SAM protein [Thermodesulfobacteriota bacterium]